MTKGQLPSLQTEEYTKHFESLPFPAWIKDISLKYVHLNQLWSNLLGLDEHTNAIGKTDSLFFPSWLSTSIMQEDMACLAGRTSVPVELKIQTPKGKTCFYRCYRKVMTDHQGKAIGILCHLLDITSESYLYNLLKTLEARQSNWLRALQDHALITTMDRRGRFTYISNSFSRLVGVPVDKL